MDAHPLIDHRPDADNPGWWTWEAKTGDRFNAVIGKLLVRAEGPGRAACRMFPEERHSNLGDMVHGGAILTFENSDSHSFPGATMRVMALLAAVLLLCGCDQLGLQRQANSQWQAGAEPAWPPAPVNAPAPSADVAASTNQADAYRQTTEMIHAQRGLDQARWNRTDAQLREDRRLERRREDDRRWQRGRDAYDSELARHQAAMDAAAAQRRGDELARQRVADERARANR